MSKCWLFSSAAIPLLMWPGQIDAQPSIRVDSGRTIVPSATSLPSQMPSTALAQPPDGDGQLSNAPWALFPDASTQLSTARVAQPADRTAHGIAVRAVQGQPVPGGGTLSLWTFVPPVINARGRIAFKAGVDGAERNQGIFTSDGRNLQVIVMGCGRGGGSGDSGSGCGDPSPIGGTFSGLFSGTCFAPDMNASGDVLFLADVNGGSSKRGLFLYRAATRDIVKIAAVGDASPLGGTLGEIGPGSLNDRGEVVFLATNDEKPEANILLWGDGIVSKHVAVGDPAPDGGTFTHLNSERLGFLDGTFMPVGPVPDINNRGQISFGAWASGGATERGLIVSTRGEHTWYIKGGDSTPDGGKYLDPWGPVLNDAGEIAFLADYEPSPGEYSAAWFVGSPGHWRKALAFRDPIDGQPCWSLAVSRNPMQPLDRNGDLLLWASVLMPDGTEQERLVVSPANGSLIVVARQGDPAPMGGTITFFESWPSLNRGRGTLTAATPGASDGVQRAHMVFQRNRRDDRGAD